MMASMLYREKHKNPPMTHNKCERHHIKANIGGLREASPLSQGTEHIQLRRDSSNSREGYTVSLSNDSFFIHQFNQIVSYNDTSQDIYLSSPSSTYEASSDKSTILGRTLYQQTTFLMPLSDGSFSPTKNQFNRISSSNDAFQNIGPQTFFQIRSTKRFPNNLIVLRRTRDAHFENVLHCNVIRTFFSRADPRSTILTHPSF